MFKSLLKECQKTAIKFVKFFVLQMIYFKNLFPQQFSAFAHNFIYFLFFLNITYVINM